MTAAQGSYLKTLCETHGAEFDPTLTKRRAWSEIKRLRFLGALKPHEVCALTPCPTCDAGLRHDCSEDDGTSRGANHQARVDAANRLTREQRGA